MPDAEIIVGADLGGGVRMSHVIENPVNPTQQSPVPPVAARIALVADRSQNVRSHARVPELFAALAERHRLALDAYWIPTEQVADGGLAGFDGVWLMPGSPYRSEAGALAAVRTAREAGIPFLGTCAGFQHALLEYARSVCGLGEVGHAENDPEVAQALIVPLSCSLVGHEGVVRLTPGTLSERLLAARQTVERYHCAYGAAAAYTGTLVEHGLRVGGVDEAGELRMVELPGHPFFLATLFQPELAPLEGDVHPVLRGFATAAVERAAQRAGV
jgi:CTP synthase (UTP-ammonia lyase)